MQGKSWQCLLAIVCSLAVVVTGCVSSRKLAHDPRKLGTLLQAQTRGGRGASKLGPELQSLYEEYAVARGLGPDRRTFSENQLRLFFGIDPEDDDPAVGLAINLKEGADAAALTKAGAAVHMQLGSVAYASVPVKRLERLALDPAVESVALMHPQTRPELPVPPSVRLREAPRSRVVGGFDKQGLTGKGVIVGVADSGIDWRHPDFINPDGTSRILYLYDLGDDSYNSSGGAIGSEPPQKDIDGIPVGTLYTQAQINAALRGEGTVKSADTDGHGTACAGTAAGNGRAAGNGVPAGKYVGVAPEADLIIVQRTSDYTEVAVDRAIEWTVKKAKELGKSCVLSLSWGGHYSAHDGKDPRELFLDDLCGEGKPGVAICIAAGNEGQLSLHAGGRFGPDRKGQIDRFSAEVELFVKEETFLDAYFNASDHWALAIYGLDKFLVDKDGKPQYLFIFTDGQRILHDSSDNYPEKERVAFYKKNVFYTYTEGKEDRIRVNLPTGRYIVYAYGVDESVGDGRFSLYLPARWAASFGQGTVKQKVVCTPGNSTNAITVSSYDFRDAWQGPEGQWRGANLRVGDVSDYSSPGYRRDDVVKPDICAPGQYAISTLAAGSSKATQEKYIVDSGRHIAWSGTSAATPYVAGVIALMLEKNPNLDADEIKKILQETAQKDNFTGSVPNIWWGYGKLNPAVAIKKTPSP